MTITARETLARFGALPSVLPDVADLADLKYALNRPTTYQPVMFASLGDPTVAETLDILRFMFDAEHAPTADYWNDTERFHAWLDAHWEEV